MIIQEYYRNFENHNRIIDNYINDRTPIKIKNILKISLTLISFSNKPHYAIVNDAVEVSKKFKNFYKFYYQSCNREKIKKCLKSVPQR